MSAAVTVKKGATYEDLCAVPSTRVAEIINGVLYSFPRPAILHAAAASAALEELGPPFKRGRGGPGGWVILMEPELHLDGDILVPDLAGWRRERMPEMPDAPHFRIAPDWVCEVLSPSTRKTDLGDKRVIYAREQVTHLWFIDPTDRMLQVLRLDGETYRIAHVWQDDAKVHAEPFEVFELDLSVLWAR